MVLAQLAAAQGQAAEVLILRSYERGFAWTESQHRGLVDALTEDMAPHLYVEHLDIKRFPQKELAEQWGQLLRTKYGAQLLDLIVTTDDPARRLVTELHEELFPGVPVVFSGADHLEPRDVAAQRKWMTGVSEKIRPEVTIEAVPRLRPETRRLWVLADRSPAGEGNAAAARQVASKLPEHVDMELIRDPSWPELRGRLAAAPTDVAVVWTHFIEDGLGKRRTIPDAVAWVVETSAAPVFASWDFSLDAGVVGGWITSGNDQGRLAGELGRQILDGASPSELPIVMEGGNRWIFGWEGLQRFDIPESRLPPDTIVVGRSPSVWDEYGVELSALLSILVVLALSTVFLAISARARRRSLRREEELSARFRAFFEALPFGVLVAEQKGETLQVVAANPAAKTLRGEGLEGRPLVDVVPQEVIRDSTEWTENERSYDGHSFPLRSNERVVVFQDVTRQKELQQGLVQAQKREAVGRLAAGVAHDLNNILQCIFTSTSFIVDADPPDQIREDAELVAASAQKASALTTQLLGFVRSGEAQPRGVELGELLRPFCGLLRRVMGETIDVVLELSSPPPRAFVDPGQLEQIVLNLALNARDAMPQGGRLRVAARREGEEVRIEVEDQGVGMDEATRSRIFEPFFTTKGPERGTGLGLSMVKELVEAQGGRVELRSEPEHGSCFTVVLPAAREDEVEAGLDFEDHRRPRGRGRRVLVVEDDGGVRRTTRRALEQAGFQVVEAGDLASAREVFAREPVELLFADVVLPDGSGRELAKLLSAENPGLQVVLTSGYDPDETSWSEEVLRKPFTLDELTTRLELAARSPAGFS